ncbi:hypothetical protein JZ751_029317 [Albula glossodonta]|uniref:Uncharacterized protein n=1 Tax=Albula glossodonta TaxID=121402 RepID=A0A8T2PAK7_9TELE|nr:hypothetical protein JZ751_029317 [Albula glossodonta]
MELIFLGISVFLQLRGVHAEGLDIADCGEANGNTPSVNNRGTPRQSEIFMPTDEEEIMEIDPYITYTENINVIYGY